MSEKYLIIIDGIVDDIVNGEVDGGVKATHDLEFANIGDDVKNGKVVVPVLTVREKLEAKIAKNERDWEKNDNLFNQWQKSEKLGWKIESITRKKTFDAHTKKVTADWRDIQKLKKGVSNGN